ncbi:charged multivesicular body protein 3 isoform X7 [Egretta garzetta]|uniref:charged multivesicular body protein 3 isoform X7 n=1 Tax=Egretta garzetta TaxID=188379 RepID=UPI00163BD7D7|nr:charged multivesicular body protein 3 isoform X7 [Egretta garzetta]
MRVIDRQIRDIQREEEKVKRSIKDAAKKGQKDVCVILAKELIRSRKAVSKLYASKAHMNSVLMGMKNQLAVLRVAGSLQKSTEVMKAMQNLVKIPEIQATMRELSKEMMKVAGPAEERFQTQVEKRQPLSNTDFTAHYTPFMLQDRSLQLYCTCSEQAGSSAFRQANNKESCILEGFKARMRVFKPQFSYYFSCEPAVRVQA